MGKEFASIERKYSLPVFNEGLQSSPEHNVSPSTSGANNNSVKAAYVVDELLTTEQFYVNELNSIIEFYMKPFERPTTYNNQLPPGLVGQQNVIFGNIADLWHFHNHIFLKDLLKSAQQSPKYVARCFLEHRAHFYLYIIYCQNKPRSERLRQEIGESHPFFQVGNITIP